MTLTVNAPKRKLTSKQLIFKVLHYAALLGLLAFILMPIYVMFAGSFKAMEEMIPSRAFFLPTNLLFADCGNTGGNFTNNFQNGGCNWVFAWSALSDTMWRTFTIVIQSTLISAFLGSINGFILARWRFPYSNLVFTMFLFGMFIPYQAIMIPLVQIFVGSGLNRTIYALVISHVIYGIPIVTLIFRNFYAQIPNELIEAARVDGAGMFTTYFRIILPLSWPAFIVVLIWQFTSAWNDFLFAAFLTGGNPRLSVVTTTLNFLNGGAIVNYGINMAAAVIASLPTLIVYIFLGRYFIRGMLAGSLKS